MKRFDWLTRTDENASFKKAGKKQKKNFYSVLFPFFPRFFLLFFLFF